MEKKYVERLRKQFVDVFLFVAGYNNLNFIKRIFDQKEKVVLLDRQLNIDDTPSVLIDNKEAFIKAIDYLNSISHKRIGFISYTDDNKTAVNRVKGYHEGLKKNNLKFDPNIVIIDTAFRLHELECSYKIINEFIKNNRKNLPNAILAASDFLIKVLKDSKINIPNDISIMGYDDILLSRYIEPTLTTIKQTKAEMGKTAINLLINLIENKEIDKLKVVLPTDLIIRESTNAI